MITLYIVNQPESTWMKEERCEGTSDTSLTKLGKAHATKIARMLAQKQIDGIITSRLHRAIQAAKIMHQFIPLKIKRDERLNEMNLGVWHGKFPEEIETRFNEVWNVWKLNPREACIPEAEQITNVEKRVISLVNELKENVLFNKYYIINTHDIITRILINHVLGDDFSKIWEYKLNPASITTVEIYPELRVQEINNREHLYV